MLTNQFNRLLAPAALILLSAAAGAAGQDADVAPIIQPGAPGQPSRVLTQAEAAIPPRVPSQADISFMQGMIMHHSQAVEMTDMLLARSRNKDLLTLGKRISISQTDEMKYMKQWLADRGMPAEMTSSGHDMMAMGHDMKGMNHDMAHMDMGSMALMPGMLTPQQMQALSKATGKTFDHLFLTGMIQHHTGALTMVQDLFNTPGAGQDPILFDFATDVDNTQSAEIKIMQGMLSKEKR